MNSERVVSKLQCYPVELLITKSAKNTNEENLTAMQPHIIPYRAIHWWVGSYWWKVQIKKWFR